MSVGVVDGRVRLDLPYEEDSRAEVDMNVVATDHGTLVEVQGTGDESPLVGETVTVSTPRGSTEYEIVNVEAAS